MMSHVLMVVTSHGTLRDGRPTGLWCEEYAVPYMALREKGVRVTVASPQGGHVPLDPRSVPNAQQSQDWRPAMDALHQSVWLEVVEPETFDGLFIPGGHGPVFDLTDNTALMRLVQAMDASHKPIAAVCHGPAGLVNARRADGSYLVTGRAVTAFTDAEETLMRLDKQVPYLLEQRLREHGAQFKIGIPMLSHVQRDGNLITGQNPASVKGVTDQFIEALSHAALIAH
jgi:putative intracellular protease/amidase